MSWSTLAAFMQRAHLVIGIVVALLALPASVRAQVDAVPAEAPEPNPWADGPEAPSPSQPLPYPQAPREEGAHEEKLDVPPLPPEPARLFLDDGIAAAPDDPRLLTTRTRDELLSRAALDLDTALVDVTGLWLRHEQAGNATLVARGLDQRAMAVVLDGVPLFDLGGLVPPLEQLSIASTARLTLHHGARAITPARSGSAGVLDVDTLGALRNQGESMALRGILGGGYGGADLEKGVFTQLETGYARTRVAVHATLLNREDQRLGRGFAGDPATREPGGVLARSGGSGGAIGARLDVVPHRGLHLFTTWHSSRALEVPRPAGADAAGVDGCEQSDDLGRAIDCTRTLERGLDAWIVGGDQDLDVGGATLVLRGRAHAQHAIAIEERAGSGIAVIERGVDEGVRSGARASIELALPPVALLDVWTPRAVLGGDVFADRFSSALFSRSVRVRDAEPPGLGSRDPKRARLEDGAIDAFSALSLTLLAEGARSTLWAGGRVAVADDDVAPEGELGVRLRLLSSLSTFLAAVHRADDDTLELGLAWALPWVSADVVAWGSSRPVGLAPLAELAPPTSAPDAPSANGPTTAWGAEARGSLRTGVEGLGALGTFALASVDEGTPFSTRTPAAAIVNPSSTITLDYAPPPLPGGFFARARMLFPQQRLSPKEEVDRTLCPQLPSEEELAAGAVRTQPCSGSPGSFVFDLGARLDLGDLRIDAIVENVLDQQGALRSEPIGFGGTSVRALLTLRL